MKKVLSLIDQFIKFCSISFLAIMILIVLLQVATRWLPVTTPTWTEEASRFLMVFMACFGGILAMKVAGGFVRVDMVVNMLPKRTSLIIEVIGEIIVCIFLITIFQPALAMVLTRIPQASASLQITMAIPQSAVFIWLIGVTVIGLGNVIQKFQDYKELERG